jgi:hypothetical protein
MRLMFSKACRTFCAKFLGSDVSHKRLDGGKGFELSFAIAT